MRSIYLDNSASTKVYPDVAELMCKTMLADYGNPSAKHIMGVEAEKYYRESREEIAETLKVKAKEILFTSGGTESDNMALIGGSFAKVRQGKHIISSAIEHPAVYKTLEFLEKQGFEISILAVDEKGHISLEELEKTIREDTVMVSIMTVNNEMGAIEDIHAIGELIKKKNPNCLFHTDAIQAYGKMILRPKKDFVDLLSVSGHKLHGPKGIGFLFIDERVKIDPILFGGGQQGGLRSGTLNIPGITGMGLAAKMVYQDFPEKIERLYQLKDYFIEELLKLPEVKVNSDKGAASAPQIVSASFYGVKAEVLLHALEDKGIYVSSGSACSSNHPGISGTLKAIGLGPKELDSTLRFSFSFLTEKRELTDTIEALKELLPVLRKFYKA